MKIALISAYCLDSTMPLAKHLAEQKTNVHLFGIMPKGNQNVYVVDFSKNKQPNGFVQTEIANAQMGKKLCEYLSDLTLKFFIFPGGGKKNFYFRDIYYAWKLSKHVINNKFDIVHLIHTSGRFSLLLMFFLKKQNLIQTLHEITDHSGDTNSSNLKILKQLIKKNIPIIFHSHISKERFLSFRSTVSKDAFNLDLYTMLRFSLYETYMQFLPNTVNNTKQFIEGGGAVVLHFGRIVPYKGIDILIDAIKIVQKKRPVHLIVAGDGDPYFNFDGIDSYQFFNYSISNEEIIHFVRSCTFVVCPYRSASQSGIPMTVFPFNKPIIASRTGGFKEIIEHNETGILVDDVNPSSFADAIETLINDKVLRRKMAINIDRKFKQGEFSWPTIAKETINFYKKNSSLQV